MTLEEKKIQELVDKDEVYAEDKLVLEDTDGTKTTTIAAVKKFINATAYIENIETLKATSFNEGEIVKTAGYHTANDGGDGIYIIVYDPLLREDNGIVHHLHTSDVLRAKLIPSNNTVTPEQFGAVGDGTTDDTTPINKALDSGYKVVFDQNKTYRVKYGLNVKDNMTLDLCGATIKGVLVNKTEYGSLMKNLTIKNGTIEGYTGEVMATLVCQLKNVLLEDLKFTNIDKASGVLLIDNGEEVYVRNCAFMSDSDTSVVAINLSPSVSHKYMRNHESVKIENCSFENVYKAIYCAADVHVPAGIDFRRLVVDNCKINRSSGLSDAVFLDLTDNKFQYVEVSNCLVNTLQTVIKHRSSSIAPTICIRDITMINASYGLDILNAGSVYIDGNITGKNIYGGYLINNLSGSVVCCATLDKGNGTIINANTFNNFTTLGGIKGQAYTKTLVNNVLVLDDFTNQVIDVNGSTLTGISGGAPGQEITLYSTNGCNVYRNMNTAPRISIDNVSIALNQWHTLKLKKVSTTTWQQIG